MPQMPPGGFPQSKTAKTGGMSRIRRRMAVFPRQSRSRPYAAPMHIVSDFLPELTRADLRPGAANRAWFFDLDGTLIDLAARPGDVTCPPGLTAALLALNRRAGGALAVITGRSRAGAMEILGTSGLLVIGLHGSDWPGATPPRPNETAVELAQRFAAAHPGVIFEDKGAAFALHYRLAPLQRAALEQTMSEAQIVAGPRYKLRPGHAVLELCPAEADKGQALARLMEMPPFLGRLPFAVGDDLTDEAMFSEVNQRGGISARIGPPRATLARHRLQSPQDLRNLLGELA